VVGVASRHKIGHSAVKVDRSKNLTDEKDRDARARSENKITEYFTPLRTAGKLEQSRLESWLHQLPQKLSKPVKPKSDEILSDQNPNPDEKLQDEVVEDFRAAGLEQRQIEQWLLPFKKRLFSQFGFDLGENDEEETGEFIP